MQVQGCDAAALAVTPLVRIRWCEFAIRTSQLSNLQFDQSPHFLITFGLVTLTTTK